MPSYVSNVELPATASTLTEVGATPAAPTGRKLKTRIAALVCAGAAAVSLTACGAAAGGGNGSAVSIASAQAGEPYVYGAAGPNSFDCSGFTQYVYGQMGKSIPRTTTEQQAAATPVSRGAAQPGDLIFIGNPAYHVGIYAGNGQFWSAPKTGDVVKLQNIWDSSYTVGRF